MFNDYTVVYRRDVQYKGLLKSIPHSPGDRISINNKPLQGMAPTECPLSACLLAYLRTHDILTPWAPVGAKNWIPRELSYRLPDV